MKIPVSGAALVGRKRCTILHEKIRGILGTGSSQKKKKREGARRRKEGGGKQGGWQKKNWRERGWEVFRK